MYNEERKMAFLTETRVSPEFGKTVFNATTKLEEERGQDLCELTSEDIKPLFDQHFGVRKRAVESSLAVIQSYAEWCAARGFHVPDGFRDIEIDMSEKIRRTMIASPMHLQIILDKCFAPVESETADCLYRCYLWMAFSGVKDHDALEVKVSDIHLEDLTIQYNNVVRELYRESLSAFRMACEATDFVYVHPRYTTRRNRFPGDKLIRGIKSDGIKMTTIRSTLQKAFDANQIETSYSKIYLSGIFYKAYEAERCGFGVNFDDVIVENMASTDRVYHGNYTPKKVANLLLRDLKGDYERWKQAFNTK